MPRALRCFGLGFFAALSLVIPNLTAQRNINPALTNNSATSTLGAGNAPNPTGIPGQFPEFQMPVFISGRVVMDEGTAPESIIVIDRVCAGAQRAVAYTDPSGHFSFQWGSGAGMLSDASESTRGNAMQAAGEIATSGQRGGADRLLGCELVADAPGFRSSRLDLSGHRTTDNPDLGLIILHRIAGVEGTSVSVSALNAPKDAKKAWEKGVHLLRSDKPADAEKELAKAVEIYPKYANAWLDLGRARIRQREVSPARDAFLKAIDADGKLVEPYVELGRMASRARNWPEAARYLDRALQLDPVDYPRLWLEDAVADFNVQNFERAEKNAREALKLPLQDRDPRANEVLGRILINKQDYAGASAALRTYLQLSPSAKDGDKVKAKLEEIDGYLAAAKSSSTEP